MTFAHERVPSAELGLTGAQTAHHDAHARAGGGEALRAEDLPAQPIEMHIAPAGGGPVVDEALPATTPNPIASAAAEPVTVVGEAEMQESLRTATMRPPEQILEPRPHKPAPSVPLPRQSVSMLPVSVNIDMNKYVYI